MVIIRFSTVRVAANEYQIASLNLSLKFKASSLVDIEIIGLSVNGRKNDQIKVHARSGTRSRLKIEPPNIAAQSEAVCFPNHPFTRGALLLEFGKIQVCIERVLQIVQRFPSRGA